MKQITIFTTKVILGGLWFALGLLLFTGFQCGQKKKEPRPEWQKPASQQASLFPYPEKGKWGFIRLDKEGKTVDRLPARWENAEISREGLARFHDKNDKCGYTHVSGQVQVQPRFATCRNYSEGLAAVEQTDGGWIVIDRQGKSILPAGTTYEFIWEFAGGLAPVLRGDKIGYIDSRGKEVLPFQFQQAHSFAGGLRPFTDHQTGKMGFLNPKGKIVIPAKFQAVWNFYPGKKGLALALAPAASEEEPPLYGFINRKGDWKIEPRFPEAWPFSKEEGLAPVVWQGKIGYLNQQGEFQIPPVWPPRDNKVFASGRAPVMIRDREGFRLWGFLDTNGGIAIPLKYRRAWVFEGQAAPVQLPESGWGYINRHGEIVWGSQ